VAVSTNWREAKLSPADYAMLEFSEKLTLLPCDMKEADVAGLRRRHGFTDREILSVTLAAGYRNFITRVADALGVELRQGENYTPEILHAFGVTEKEAQTTMYGDRQVAEQNAELPAGSGRPHCGIAAGGIEASQTICWMETAAEPSQEARDAAIAGLPRNLARVLSLRPEALRATLGFGRLAGLGGSGLGRRLEATIGLTVAAALQVPYMVAHHASALRDAGGDGIGMTGRGEVLGLDQREEQVARFCEKLTRLPSPMARSDLEAVRACGFEDRDLLTIVASTAFENFLGRVAAGVGVRPETAGKPQ
jgi:alkylhydroperoxidase family enzyme